LSSVVVLVLVLVLVVGVGVGVGFLVVVVGGEPPPPPPPPPLPSAQKEPLESVSSGIDETSEYNKIELCKRDERTAVAGGSYPKDEHCLRSMSEMKHIRQHPSPSGQSSSVEMEHPPE
jgi:hypothetical protein